MSTSVGVLPFIKIGALIGATAAVGFFSKAQFDHAGQWLPPMPDKIGYWTGEDEPLAQNTLAALGNPKADGHEYMDPFGEHVEASLVSAGPFENYHDPTVCVTGGGFNLTAKKTFHIDGPRSGLLRAMIFRRGAVRLLLYYWQQNRDGNTSAEPRMGNFRDILARFETGYGAVVQGHQTVLVRVLTVIGSEDPNGVQAQRNLNEVARAIYHALLEDGTGKDQAA
jgi:hypothetical protein